MDRSGANKARIWMVLLSLFVLCALPLSAQTGGEAGIQGSIVDSSGAVIPGATVTATDNATGVSTTRITSSAGLYTISPILPGVYTITAKANGFSEAIQKNLNVDALKLTGLNLTLAIGTESQEITVTLAPPALETTNATLGAVLENKTYENLPLQMSGQQRDPTAFATLVPGTVSGSRTPVIGGTGNYLAAVYVDGVPDFTINQQGDNRVVSNSIPVEAIDQFQVVTSSPDAEYEGAGLVNFTLKSGGNKYHGIFATYVRARMFDAWSYASKDATYKNPAGQTVPEPKPDEHQSEIVASGGGPIPFTHHKGFFYVTYDRYHGRTGINPNFLTVPTTLMREGNFSELSSANVIYDPTSTAACTSADGGTLCRNPYQGNIIPSDELSPIAQKMQSYLPDVTSSGLVNNYYGGVPSGYQNWEVAGRVDYDLTPKQRLSLVAAYGSRTNVPFTVGNSGVVLPLPYTNGGTATIVPVVGDVEHAWQISNSMTNQFKFAFDRFSQPVGNLTYNISPYRAVADLGITNLPEGQASDEFPGASFGTTTAFPSAISAWTANGASGANQTTVPNTYTLLDNFLITKGQHNITIGAQLQWLEDNVASQTGYSGIYTIPYSANSTANYGAGSTSLNTTTTGFAYASYLLGAAGASGIAIQSVSETGGRYHDVSPYVEDNWKITPKLTVNLGLRWDYFPPFHEVQDRWSFLNPSLTNAVTGNAGELQFAGTHGGPGVSCNCRTPVHSFYKNFGPRLSLAYAIRPTTVLRAGYALVYSIGGGVGGRGGAGNGTGATGFNVSANSPTEVTSGADAGPSYYLNNSQTFTNDGLANTAFGGPGYILPTPTTPSAATQTLETGNYVNGSGSFVTPGSVAYADPYLSGRAPEFAMYNAGIQQSLTNSLTLTLNYAGTQSHFLLASGSNGRGYWAGQLNPKYLLALGAVADSTGKAPLLGALATPANVAIAQAHLSGYTLPYPTISATNTKATIAQTLLAFPQYSGVSDTWGNVANISYNAMEVTLAQRQWHGLSYSLNYTWSKNIGDDGTYRGGYDLPAGVVSGTNKAFKQNRIDRSRTLTDTPQNIAMYGYWDLPFGKGHIGNNSAIARALASGFQISTIFRYTTGVPLVITYGGCNSPNAGTCEVDYNPNFTGSVRENGKMTRFGVQYINPNAFKAPATISTNLSTNYNLIGNVTRTAPFNLRQPTYWDDDMSLRRTFGIPHTRLNFIAEVDCLNVANHPTLTGLTAAWGAPGTAAGNAFGTLTGAQANQRDFQFAGRLTF
ncbi:MAG: carboxypeptidase regulatory-like domain-containing protein [Acidobacteriaceae bacterium]